MSFTKKRGLKSVLFTSCCRDAVARKTLYLESLNKLIKDLQDRGFELVEGAPTTRKALDLEDEARTQSLETDLAAARAR